jgi:predicted ester cyclase
MNILGWRSQVGGFEEQGMVIDERSRSMSEERVAKVRRIVLEVFGKGNLEAMGELYDPQVIRHNPPYQDANGLQAYKEFNKGILNAWSDIQFNVHEIFIAGDASVIRFTLVMTHTGETPLSRLSPTGKRVSQEGCVIAHWRGDRIVEEWIYADVLGLLQQLGAIPTTLAGAAK